MTFFVGGEFWDDPRFQTGTVNIPVKGMTFLNGGEAAIRLICSYLSSMGINELLMPAYICSTMADAFDRYGITYTYYRLQENFRIDLDDLLKKAGNQKALYIVNYFGYGFAEEETKVFGQLKGQGMLLIEDDAQAGFNRASLADVRFNSLRKMVPYDGSFFYSNRDLSAHLAKFAGLPNQRLPIIRRFRKTFARLLDEGAENFDELNPLFDESERQYYADLTVWGDPDERAAAERLDWAAIEAKRKANHQRLLERLSDVPGIEIIFPKVSPNGLPLGFPIYTKNGRREALLNHLREQNVYPVVHWDILKDPRINKIPQTVAMSTKILTLILDQRFDLEDMDYEASLVRTFFWH
jgi:hypothetical protein